METAQSRSDPPPSVENPLLSQAAGHDVRVVQPVELDAASAQLVRRLAVDHGIAAYLDHVVPVRDNHLVQAHDHLALIPGFREHLSIASTLRRMDSPLGESARSGGNALTRSPGAPGHGEKR